MSEAAPDAGVRDGAQEPPELNAALLEPLTIADAARRAGVHPNTVRRLIRQGRVAARMVRGRYGDTWLVESADIDRAVGGHFQPGGTPPGAGVSGAQPTGWSGPIESPDSLPAAADLSLDRARALERYTHGLLQPLVDLLREREAALESRDELIRTQAERIGRLERELELINAAPPVTTVRAADPPTDDLPAHVSSLAGQVGRLRAELQLIASAFQPDVDEEPVPVQVSAPPEEANAPEEPAADPMPTAPAVTAEELASLFPVTSRGRLTLRPLEGDGEAEPPPTPAPPEADPFAQAEAAVQELRRALAPNGGASAVAPHSDGSTHDATASTTPVAAESRPRRWWWPW